MKNKGTTENMSAELKEAAKAPIITKKIDFVATIVVNGANPNGNPLDANRPRVDNRGYGEISDVCLKHKLRMILDAMWQESLNREDGNAVLLVGNNYGDERVSTVQKRIEEYFGDKFLLDESNKNIGVRICEKFIDVRCFGTLLAVQKAQLQKGKQETAKPKRDEGLSVPVTGAVTIQTAKSVQKISVVETQITKSMSFVSEDKKGSDTMGLKYRVDRAAYVVYGTISPYMAEKNKMTTADAEAIKYAIKHMFDLDASAARPSGTMEVKELFWMTHPSKLGSKPSAAVHRAVEIVKQEEYPFYKATLNKGALGDIECEVWSDED